MEAIFSENTRGEVTRWVHTDGVQTQKWVRSSLTSASKAHLICECRLCPCSSSPSRTSPSAGFPRSNDYSRKVRTGSGVELHGWAQDSSSSCTKDEAFASDRSTLKTIGEQPNLTASHHKTRLHRRNAAGHRSSAPHRLTEPARPTGLHWPWVVRNRSSVNGEWNEIFERTAGLKESKQGSPWPDKSL